MSGQFSQPDHSHRALRRELTELITLRAWGALDSDGFARLNELVTSGEAACRLYVDLMLETAALGRHAGLWRVAQSSDAAESALSLEGRSPETAEDAATFLDVPGLTQFADDACDVLPTMQLSESSERDELRRPKSLRWVGIAAAVALMFWSVLAIWVFPRLRGNPDSPSIAAGSPIGRLIAAAGCEWSGDAPLEPGDEIPAGVVSLLRGTAEMQLANGVRLVIEGPSRFDLSNLSVTELHSGSLTARVPEKAKGYSVATPTATIVDLGTEFGVVTSESGETEVQVFQGRVSVQPLANGNLVRPAAIILVAGESNRVEANPATGDVTVTRLAAPTKAPPRALPKVAAAKINFPNSLVAYWNFDEDHGPVWDERGKNHGVLEEAKRVPGIIGKGAVQFDNVGGQQVRVPALTGDLQFVDGVTIEAVFIAKWSGSFGDFDGILRKEDGASRILLAFQNDGVNGEGTANPPIKQTTLFAFGLNVGDVYQELDMPLDGQDDRPTVAAMTDGKPHHVAATYDRRTGRKQIYIDGCSRFHVDYPAGTPIASGGTEPLIIGNAAGGGEPFTGQIDEVAIYNAALSADEIAHHWQGVQARRNYFQSMTLSHTTHSIDDNP